ncbi:phosphotyrosine protein phosphatase [Saccharobesus litoralis]|uniref:protein-tyrosine-phosphatase n=1 Tax=Saccharobesus litoralis TaxID=2172099 RepID=A0A2S0VXN6_9ALTE|nr:low molecular weight protein-tyrosine-phosphatase [Saccharobesus litoralis]AWB68989.1 phosphotyrosine protein phosphatase [Saccharobesus litoralis]
MFNSILVVCAGNICRSPTAEYQLKTLLKDTNIQVSSAGLTALVDKPADDMATTIAASQNIDLSTHKGRQLSSVLVAENDLILVMEERHISDLCAKYPQARGKTFLLGKWLDNKEVPDPYRKSQEAFEHVFSLIQDACKAWLKYL